MYATQHRISCLPSFAKLKGFFGLLLNYDTEEKNNSFNRWRASHSIFKEMPDSTHERLYEPELISKFVDNIERLKYYPLVNKNAIGSEKLLWFAITIMFSKDCSTAYITTVQEPTGNRELCQKAVFYCQFWNLKAISAKCELISRAGANPLWKERNSITSEMYLKWALVLSSSEIVLIGSKLKNSKKVQITQRICHTWTSKMNFKTKFEDVAWVCPV